MAMLKMFAPSASTPPSANRKHCTINTVVSTTMAALGPSKAAASTPPTRCPDVPPATGKLTICAANKNAAVSGLTNPDGTYRIDGIPAGNYVLYVHPLPPDAVPADGSGLRPPQDQNGGQFLPNGVFGTVFYPGTLDPKQATTITASAGSILPNQTFDFTVQTRTSVPAYDLITSSYLDPQTLLTRSEEHRV